MKCSNCGYDLPNNTNTCPNCGFLKEKEVVINDSHSNISLALALVPLFYFIYKLFTIDNDVSAIFWDLTLTILFCIFIGLPFMYISIICGLKSYKETKDFTAKLGLFLDFIVIPFLAMVYFIIKDFMFIALLLFVFLVGVLSFLMIKALNEFKNNKEK